MTGTYDLTGSDNDEYKIDDYYHGLTQWKIDYDLDNVFTADKFQLDNPSTNE